MSLSCATLVGHRQELVGPFCFSGVLFCVARLLSTVAMETVAPHHRRLGERVATLLRISFVMLIDFILIFGDLFLRLSRGKGLWPGELRSKS